MSTENCVCTELNVDTNRCSSIDGTENSYVEFACAGIHEQHLTAKAEVLGSTASDCATVLSEQNNGVSVYGGQALVMGALGRYCQDGDGNSVLQNSYGCMNGMETEDDDGAIYCVTGNECSIAGGPSCDVEVDGLISYNFDEDPTCSYVDPDLDLSEADFFPTMLTSFHFVEWTYSGEGLGCSWEAPPVQFSCSNGGTIYMDEDTYFCQYFGDSVICTPPSGEDRSGPRVSHYFSIWCYGDTTEQLDLTAEIEESEASGSCLNTGLAIQGLWVARACGNFLEDDLEYSMEESFCTEFGQHYNPEQEGQHALCVFGYRCEEDSCNNLMLPKVAATSSDELGSCIHAY